MRFRRFLNYYLPLFLSIVLITTGGFFWYQIAQAASVTFNNTNTIGHCVSSPCTVSLSVTAGGTNTMAFAIVGWDKTDAVTMSCTYGGNAMTSAGAQDENTVSSLFAYSQVFYLAAPPTGANNLVCTASGTVADIYENIVSFTNVNQTTPVRPGSYQNPSNPAFDGSGNYSIVITSNTSDLTLTAMNSGFSAGPTSNQTRDGTNTAGNYGYCHDHATTAASSVTHTWAGSANENIAIVGFSIQAPSSVAANASTTRVSLPFGRSSILNGRINIPGK